MSDIYSICEILEMGIQIEKNGLEFYSALKTKFPGKGTQQMFEYLAEAEANHVKVFERLFDAQKECDYEIKEAYPQEYFAFLKAMAGQHIFTEKEKGKVVAEGIGSSSEAIEIGIKFEKDSIILFEEMKKFVPKKDHAVIDALIAEEQKHLMTLYDLKGGVIDEER